MKKLLLILLFTTAIINAQTKEYTHSLKGIKKVKIDSEASIIITSENTSQITLIDNAFNHKEHHHNTEKEKEKKKGLTAIYARGKDNTNGLGFAIEKEEDILVITDLKSSYQRHGIQLKLPKTMNVQINSGDLGKIEVSDFTSEIEAESNVGSITLNNVTGPITAHSSVGPIKIDFVKVNQSAPITVSSSVSEIDISLPSDTKANLDLKTNGTVYTNFDIQSPPKKGMKNVSGLKRIETSINNGGVKIKLKSSMGNIYLRKKE